MHQIIKEHFVDTTVIEIAHRLESILDFDRVLVLERGNVVEFDEPGILLSRNSLFAKMFGSRISGKKNKSYAIT